MINKEFENFDRFLEYIKGLPKTESKVLNAEKYQAMLEAAMLLKEVLKERAGASEIEIEADDTFSSGSITTELDELTVYSPNLFAQVIKDADNFEVYPLTNGKIRLSIMYYGMFKKGDVNLWENM